MAEKHVWHEDIEAQVLPEEREAQLQQHRKETLRMEKEASCAFEEKDKVWFGRVQ